MTDHNTDIISTQKYREVQTNSTFFGFCFVLFLFCFVLFCFALLCFALLCVALFCFVLFFQAIKSIPIFPKEIVHF